MSLQRRSIIILVFVLVLSSPIGLISSSAVGQVENDPSAIAINDVPPDEKLRGASVVRRPESDPLPEMKESWTRVFQGTKHGENECGYSLEFFEPYETATPKVIALKAVDLDTCQVEFEIGIPVKATLPEHEGGIATGGEEKARPVNESDVEEPKRGYAAPGVLSEFLEEPGKAPLALGGHTRKFTVTSEWRDPELGGLLDKTIVDVSTAVRIKIRGGEVEEGSCKRGFW